MLSTVEKWITGSISRRGETGEVFVAIGENEQRLGFASVSEETHFTGEKQGYIGELAVTLDAERRGVGRALVQACEDWSRARGYRVLALSTGAANHPALEFYRRLDFRQEDVKLVKLLDRSSTEP